MPRRRARRGAPRKAWAMLAYIAGDNNLSDYGLVDIREMCEEGASTRLHAAAEIDTYGEHTGSVRYEISEPDWTGTAHRIVIERLPEKDSGDPETLRSFLRWGLGRYPADRTLVVIWNHGAGFRSVRRDIGYDDFGSSLDMPEVRDALRRAGVGRRNRIAILGFDACLMNMLEIVSHFRDQVEVVVGSQQTEPGDGWPYEKVLAVLKGSADTGRAARELVRAYIDDYRAKGVFDVTQSAVDVDATASAMRELGRLGNALAARMGSLGPALRAIRMEAQVFEMADYVDLVHLAEQVRARVDDDAVAARAGALASAARACVLLSETLGDSVKGANGLSVWFPATASLYASYRGKYLALRSVRRSPGWVRFLDAYHGAG